MLIVNASLIADSVTKHAADSGAAAKCAGFGDGTTNEELLENCYIDSDNKISLEEFVSAMQRTDSTKAGGANYIHMVISRNEEEARQEPSWVKHAN